MKKIIYSIFLLALTTMVGCKVDPLKDIEAGNWSKERNIVALQVEGQIGTVIIERDPSNAVATVNAKLDNIEDIANVKILNIELSYGATTVNAVGTTLDFSDGNIPTINVVSQKGESLEWKVKMNPFKSDLEGTWYIGEIGAYCDLFTWESWGWEKSVSIIDYLPLAKPELDNVITFTVEGADAKGNPYGNFENAAGADNGYGDFTGDGFTAVEGSVDFNNRFRLVPKGEGTWLRDYEQNKVILTDAYDKEYSFTLEINSTDSTVALKAELEYIPGNFNWNANDYRYEELAHMSKNMWYKFVKNAVEIPQSSDCNVVAFAINGQVKDAIIDNDNNTIVASVDGTVNDLSALEIETLTLPAFATSDVQAGTTHDFSGGKTISITVTAEDGTTKTYTVSVADTSTLPSISIAGTWNVNGIEMFVDFFSWESWGNSETKPVENFFPNITTEYDNKLTLTITTADNGSGVESGTYDFTSGADATYTDFIYNSTSSKVPNPVDMNARLRVMPKGSGTFVYTKNAEHTGGTLVITAGGADYTFTVNERAQTDIVLTTELTYNSGPFDWDNATVDYNYEKLNHLSKSMWYNLGK